METNTFFGNRNKCYETQMVCSSEATTLDVRMHVKRSYSDLAPLLLALACEILDISSCPSLKYLVIFSSKQLLFSFGKFTTTSVDISIQRHD